MRGWTRLLALAAALLVGTHSARADLRYFDDATLRAVQFIDDKEGWAVGDEGVVWHTLNGGRSWARLPTGVRASLRSVHFLTPEVGWVAGREEQPFGGSVGVLLFTRDGGLKWQQLLTGALPGLNQVRFLDVKTGYLLGDGCDQFPSGVFKTTDGGRSWEPVAGPRTTTWHAGDFLPDGSTGLLAGGWARLGKLHAGKFNLVDDVERTEGRHIRGLQILPGRAVAVGQGGLVLTSVSGGARWGFADLKLSPELLACLDFHALHAAGQKVWVVGRPGSVVLHSPDAGVTWMLQKTGQPLPLQGVYFFDERRGWAVGEAGTILATADGGQSWQVQRQAGKRAAALVVQARGSALPVDTLTQLGACEGYLTPALRVVGPDAASAPLARATDALRHAAASRLAGGLTGESLWAFALPEYLDGCDKTQVLEYWNRRHAQAGGQELLRQLVLSLRVWRPSVVLGDHPEAKDAVNALVAEALQEAVRQANDPKAFPEQLEQLGLEPWQVSKVYGLWDRNTGSVVQDNDTLQPALQATVRDHAGQAANLLHDRPTPLPAERYYRLVQTQLPGAEQQNHWMLGVVCKEGESRRTLPAATPLPEEVADALRQKKQLVALAENVDAADKLQALIVPTLARLPEEQGAAAAFAIAGEAARRGRWDLAQETYLIMVERYPAHPLSAEAYRWLVRHGASGEARLRQEQKQSVTRAEFNRPQGKAPVQPTAATKDEGPSALLRAFTGSRPGTPKNLDLAKRLAGFGPLFASDPSVQFSVQAARRNLGDTTGPADWYAKFADYVTQGPWHEAARAEAWLAGRAVQPPQKLARCRLTDARPHLDGNFDDACWQNLTPMVLDNAAGDTRGDHPTYAWFAYDQEFLYVALKCKHPAGRRVEPVKKRPRDADLDAFDRVSILLDLDRDYSTYFRLEVDQRGCVREDCWGDRGWDPRWFVAVKTLDDCWQIEAAIPLGELTSRRVELNSAWAFNVVRTLPGRGVQSWSQPANVRPRPEGMSLLQFTQDANRASAQPMPAP